jgi:hypothetical protein
MCYTIIVKRGRKKRTIKLEETHLPKKKLKKPLDNHHKVWYNDYVKRGTPQDPKYQDQVVEQKQSVLKPRVCSPQYPNAKRMGEAVQCGSLKAVDRNYTCARTVRGIRKKSGIFLKTS